MVSSWWSPARLKPRAIDHVRAACEMNRYGDCMKLRLISHKQCPFVQRAIIVLLEKNVAHETEYVDLKNKPDWFQKLSPRGKVPLLVADGVTLFESGAICEFLEETHPEPPLMPKDPIERARDRGWFAFAGDDLYTAIYRAGTDKPDDLAAALGSLDKSLTRLDDELAGREFLSGDGKRFGMADVFLAPFFVRAQTFANVARTPPIPERLARVRAYGERLLARDTVKRSIPTGFADDYVQRLRDTKAAALR
jgi:glutathione S-transferase